MKESVTLMSSIKGIRRYFLLAMIFVGIETLFEVIIPFLMADILDIGVLKHDTSVFLSRGLWMLACALGSLIFGFAYSRSAARFAAGVAYRIRQAEFEKINSFSFENMDHFESSSLITRMTSDVMTLQNTITNGIRPIARGPLMLVLGMFMCFAINFQLSLVFLGVMPFLALILVFIVHKVAPQYVWIQKTVDALNAAVEENLTAIRLVKSFVRDDYEQIHFDQINRELQDLNTRTNHYAFLNLPAFQGSMYTCIVILLLLGTQMILQNTIQVGELTGILSYVLQILNAFVMMSNVFLLLTRSMASFNRINEVFQEKPTMELPVQGVRMQDGSVSMESVSFKYSKEAKEDVLKDITLDIPCGSTFGIIGPTGSAKSSLVWLIDRLYDLSSGTLKVGQENIKDLDLKQLRDDVAMVLQNNVLFSGTIRSNLLWGNPSASEEELIQACRDAGAWEFVERIPGGLDAVVEQGGVNFSGGQKQRLCIARALLKKPKILIFDDSTSAVDTRTDRYIRESLAKIKGLTQIIISQRLSSLQHCDQIAVLEDGQLAAVGPHEKLLETSPLYKEIYESQQGGEENEQ